MSGKTVHFVPRADSSWSTKYASEALSDDSSDDEEYEQLPPKPQTLTDMLQTLFLGKCCVPPSQSPEFIVEEVFEEKGKEEQQDDLENLHQLPMLLGGRVRPRADSRGTQSAPPTLTKPREPSSVPMTRYKFDSLEEQKVLGYGAFGSVTLVKCRTTGQTLALKKMSKGMILQNKMYENIANEKRAMQQANSPFVIKLAACFNRGQHLYFLMEVATGGDLFSFYTKNQAWGSEDHARFYIACIAVALSHLHEHLIIYRDIKLENVVLDSRGYAKLCDFGLAKFMEPGDSRGSRRRSGKTYTTCGTPDYMAPETVSSRGYTVAADWWSLGVLAFSILTGKMPFNARDPRDILAKARAGINRAKFPKDREWPELVKGLCAKDPYERLPILEGGLQNVQELAWYRNAQFDWAAHGSGRMVPPYIPSYCDVDTEDMMEPPPEVKYVDPKTGWDADFEDVEGPSKIGM